MQPSAAVGFGQAVDPLGGGGEQHAMTALAGPDRQADGEVGLAGARRAQEHHVVPPLHEVEGAQVGDDVTAQGALVVEVEVLQVLRAGKRAARMRISPPLDCRAATCQRNSPEGRPWWGTAAIPCPRDAQIPRHASH